MTPAQWFDLANPLALLGWLLLGVGFVLAPGRARSVLLLIAGRVLPLVLCVGYVSALVAFWGTAPGGGFGSLEAVAALFRSPGVLLAGWVHYLAFDLFIGRWIVDDASARAPMRASVWRRAIWLPVLALTFLYGPAGLLAWFALRRLAGPAPAGLAARGA